MRRLSVLDIALCTRQPKIWSFFYAAKALSIQKVNCFFVIWKSLHPPVMYLMSCYFLRIIAPSNRCLVCLSANRTSF